MRGGGSHWMLGGEPAAGVREVVAPSGIAAFDPAEMTVTVGAGTTLVDLGKVYGELGDSLRKRDAMHRALEIFERHSPEHPKVATTLMDLGIAWGVVGLGAAQKLFLMVAPALPRVLQAAQSLP